VLSACEKAKAWALPKRNAYEEVRKQRVSEYEASIEKYRDQQNERFAKEYEDALSLWKRKPFFIRWFVKKPTKNELCWWYGKDLSNYSNIDSVLRMEHDMDEVAKVLHASSYWEETLRWLPRNTSVVMDDAAANAIGIGVMRSRETEE
jgi:hypothetical protein